MRFPRQGYWNGLPFPSPGDLPKPGIKPGSPALQADSLLTELQGKPGGGWGCPFSGEPRTGLRLGKGGEMGAHVLLQVPTG